MWRRFLCRSWQQVLQQRGSRLHQWWIKAQQSPSLHGGPPSAAGTGGPLEGDREESVSVLDAKKETQDEEADRRQQQGTEKQQQQEIAEAEAMERDRLLAREPLPTSKRGFINSPKFVLKSLVRLLSLRPLEGRGLCSGGPPPLVLLLLAVCLLGDKGLSLFL